MAFRFIHTADLHLDSPLRSLALRNPELAELVGDASRQAFTAIIDLCIDEKVDALLIAGDLYDGDQTSMKTARFLASQMQRLHEAGIRAFIIRGNHDALSRITPELILPDSVTRFGARAGTVEIVGNGVPVAIHGLSFARPQAPDSLLDRYRRPVADSVNIGMMHTSLAGAPGHDPYAPCRTSDLHEWGFDYWALGHVHRRAEHPGARVVVMPGMPQGRDIGESGEKSVTLVTVHDDRRLTLEERPTGVAQFERLTVDLSAAGEWRDAVDRTERQLAALRDRVASRHLVVRVRLAGATPLAWQIRRDRDLLRTELDQRAEGMGRVWIEKLELATEAPRDASQDPGTDPVLELGQLMREDVLRRPSVREAVRALVEELRDELPPDARGLAGEDEAAFEEFVGLILAEGSEDMLARLQGRDRG